MTYYTSMEEHPIDILNLPSLEERVKANMERGAFGYIRGGSEDEWTLRENTRAFDDLQIIPRVLQGLSGADLSTSIFGISLKTPVIEAPSAAHGLAHVKGEIDTAIGTAAAGSLFSLSTYGSTDLRDLAAAVPGAPQFFQLYMSKDDGFNAYLVKKAVKAGVKAIILTVDSTLGGYREEDVRNHFQFPLPMPTLPPILPKTGSAKALPRFTPRQKRTLFLPILIRSRPSLGCPSSSKASSRQKTRRLPSRPVLMAFGSLTMAGGSSMGGLLPLRSFRA